MTPVLLSQSANHWGIIAVGMIITQSQQVKTKQQHIRNKKNTAHLGISSIIHTGKAES